jgi:hypothetical protein
MLVNQFLVTQNYCKDQFPAIAFHLEAGRVVLLRDVTPIKEFREHLIEICCAYGDSFTIKDELIRFYEAGESPSEIAIYALRCGIRDSRAIRLLSQYMAPLVERMGFDRSILLDGGISRLVLPKSLIEKIRQSQQFDSLDFIRERADGPTETFMPGPANIHRDFNRRHSLFQCNIWFPLHDACSEEVLRIWPDLYHDHITDMPATPDNLRRVGKPIHYELNFGDAIIFHGEHLHTSPARLHGAEDYRRHTYDFRIATRCGDDNHGYRDNFSNIANFIGLDNTRKPSSDNNFGVNYRERFREEKDSANFYLYALENNGDIKEGDINDIFEIFLSLPFAEDRFFLLVEKALDMSLLDLSCQAGEQIRIRSRHYFWLLRCGEIFEKYGMMHIAKNYYQRCREVLSNYTPNFCTNPIDYNEPSNELLLDKAIGFLNSKLS